MGCHIFCFFPRNSRPRHGRPPPPRGAAFLSGAGWALPLLLPVGFFFRDFLSAPARDDGGGVFGPLFFYDVARLARRGRGTLLHCGYALLLLGMLCGAWRSHFPEVSL